jgi:hypothetical protein
MTSVSPLTRAQFRRTECSRPGSIRLIGTPLASWCRVSPKFRRARKGLRMTKSYHKAEITRRGFFERTAGGLATAGILAGGLGASEAGPDPGELDSPTPDSRPTYGKIELEEHFAVPGTIPDGYTSLPTPESRRQIQDLGSGRIAEMDRSSLELCILSESGPASRLLVATRGNCSVFNYQQWAKKFPASNVIPASKPSVLRQSLADGKLILTLFPPDPERKTGWHRRTIRKPRRAGGGFGSH